MRTRRKRVQVALSDEVWALVEEVHTLTGTSRSAVIAEMLDMITPVIQSQIGALRVLHESPREAQRILQDFANESVSKLGQAQLDLDAAIDARTVKGRRAKTGGIRGRTP